MITTKFQAKFNFQSGLLNQYILSHMDIMVLAVLMFVRFFDHNSLGLNLNNLIPNYKHIYMKFPTNLGNKYNFHSLATPLKIVQLSAKFEFSHFFNFKSYQIFILDHFHQYGNMCGHLYLMHVLIIKTTSSKIKVMATYPLTHTYYKP